MAPIIYLDGVLCGNKLILIVASRDKRERTQPHDECRQRLPSARHAALCEPLSKRVGGAWHPGRALLRRYARSGRVILNLTENILN